MSQKLKDSTRGRKRDNDKTTMDMPDDDSNLSSLGASRKYAARNKSRNICGRHRSDSYLHLPSAPPCDDHTWVCGTAKAMIRILAPVSSVRNVTLTQSRIWMLSSLASNNIDESLELDSHDDTCVIGKYYLILNDYERPVTVYLYYRSLGAQ